MPKMGQQRRRVRRSDSAQGKRRIYDPQRWHRRSSGSGTKNVSYSWGQPPTGWMLIWAGRFKRWRRRWFVAHPPGLLLHYKNSEQNGRPGCISLLGATATPTPGKERQMKIVRGSMVYYLRTVSKDYRQGWLDAIHESIRVYNKSVEKVGTGVMPPGGSTLPKQSVPEHVKEEWEAQERELNQRLAERMQDLEPTVQEFLRQLQLLQQSMTVISGALGLCADPKSKAAVSATPTATSTAENYGPDSILSAFERVDGRSFQGPRSSSVDEGFRKFALSETGGSETSPSRKGALAGSISLPESSFLRSQRSIFKWKAHGEHKQGKKRSSKSAPSITNLSEKSISRSKRHSFRFPLEESPMNPQDSLLPEGSCIGAECFKWKKKPLTFEDLEIGPLTDSKFMDKIHGNGLKIPHVDDSKQNHEDVESEAFRSKELGYIPVGDSWSQLKDNDIVAKNGEARPAKDGLERELGKETNYYLGEVDSKKQGLSHLVSEKCEPDTQSTLHAAWHRMHEAFAEALKVEIHRCLELEAENAVLQESLAELPQLQKDQTMLINLRESLQNSGSYGDEKLQVASSIHWEDGDDEVDGHETDGEFSGVHSDLPDEEYFEALEVLQQHDFVAKLTTSEEQEVYLHRDDGAQEPSEEDVPPDIDLLSEAEGDDMEQPRTRLPCPRPLSRGFSLWTVLKNAIGKDLNKITMPATINEPLSVLQKCAEDMQYKYLLEIAGEDNDPIARLLNVTAFACASYHDSIYRDAKPFNPLLGETYEWLAPDEKSWFLTEQVSHHPPIMAFHSENTVGDYKIYGEIEIRSKFWGKSVEVLPTGVCHLRFGKYGDHFTWKKITTCAHNVVVGKLWIDNYGEFVIKNHTTGDVGLIRLHKAGSKDQCRVSGKIYDDKGVPQFSISGNYQDQIVATPANGEMEHVGRHKMVLWESPPRIEDFQQQYCFSKFSIGLNELTNKLADAIPPTDSRFRPDQRALEDGDLDKATPEKLRLESKQREASKLRKEKSQDWQCQWFAQRVPGVSQVQSSDDCVEPSWIYRGKYWEAREKRMWQGCPDIM